MILSRFICCLFIYLIVLLGMSFFTLLERKALGYFQLRKGPNKVGVIGIFQPFADALKLFTKEINFPGVSNYLSFIVAPVLRLGLALVLWYIYPRFSPSFILKFGVLLFICVSRLRVYTILAAGWSSNSKYALLGALRSIAQTISYEVSISLIMLGSLVLLCSLDFVILYYYIYIRVFFLCFPLFFVWFCTILAETNRTPFDFSEGESELVSGFNTEYRRGTFALIFMAEYLNILVISLFSVVLFFPVVNIGIFIDLFIIFFVLILSFLFVWVRGTLPRIRYDLLIYLTWKGFLPFSLGVLFSIISFFFLIWYHAGWTGNLDEINYRYFLDTWFIKELV